MLLKSGLKGLSAVEAHLATEAITWLSDGRAQQRLHI